MSLDKYTYVSAFMQLYRYMSTLWPPNVKSQLFGKDSDAGKN